MSLNEQIESQILSTTGISSKVFEDNQFKGHILLLDYDNTPKRRILQNITKLSGISCLRPSSSTGWHVWNLTIRTRDETALLALELNDDPNHVQVGYNRHSWVLRLGPKFDENYDEYKPAPGNIEVFSNPTVEYQSRPHLDILKSRFQHRFKRIEDKFCWKGDRTQLETYMTLTDPFKEELNNGRL